MTSERLEPRTVFAVGDLDLTFGGDGIVMTELNQGNTNGGGTFLDTALQSDGKIVAVGDRYLSRFMPDGGPDVDAPIGSQTLLPSELDGNSPAVLVQFDGKIVVGGGINRFTLVRYNADLTLDTTFSTDGVAFETFADGGRLNNIALQPDGKIVAVGYAVVGGTLDFAVMRFNADGSPDTSFDLDGLLVANLSPNNSYDLATDVVLQSDGKIAVVGTAATNLSELVVVARFNANGGLDGTFDGDGVKIFGSSGNNQGRAVALDEDENIIVGGYAVGPSLLARILPNGTLDPAFDLDGVLTFNSGGNGVTDVEVQADGKIIAVSPENNNLTAYRFNADGTADSAYGVAGKASVDFGPSDFGFSGSLQPDGKLILAGRAQLNSSLFFAAFALARLDASGTLDPAFDTDGKVTKLMGPSSDVGQYLAVQPDGKTVVAGIAHTGLYGIAAVARYLPNGDLDPDFGVSGAAIHRFADDLNVSGLVVLADGKLLISGSGRFGGTDSELFLTRFTADGTLDTTFGGDGVIQSDLADGNEGGTALAIDADGKIVVIGAYYDSALNQSKTLVARYLPDGSFDSSFDQDGTAEYLIGVSDSSMSNVQIQDDGKVVLSGYALNAQSNSDFAVFRLNVDGSPDMSFGTAGLATAGNQGNSEDYAMDARLQADGKIVVVGRTSSQATGDDGFIVRFLADGGLDPTFNFTGKRVFDLGSTPISVKQEMFEAVAIQADGKIVIGGNNRNVDGFLVVRLNFDGSFDRSFSGDGVATYGGGPQGPYGFTYDIAALDDGNLEVTGYAQVDSTADLAVLRIIGSEPNQVPTADAQTVSTDEDTPLPITLTGSDPDLHSLEFTLVTAPQHGVLSGSGANHVYTPDLNYFGGDSFIFKVDDGHGGVVASTVTINVNSVNDRPANVLQSLTAETVDENSFRVFSADEGNRITVSDVDAAGADVQLTLSVSHGTLSLATVAGLSFNFTPDANGSPLGDGTADSKMVFRGTMAAINTALNGLTYTPAPFYDGPDVLAIRLNDLGNSGSGGAKSDLDSINLNVIDSGATGPNVPPTFTMKGSDIVLEDAALQEIFGWATANAGPAHEPQAVQYVIDDNSDPSLFSMPPEVTPAGTLRYQPAPNKFGEAVITLHVNDSESDSPTQQFTIKIFPVNDRPVATQNVYGLNEDQVLTVSAANGVLNNDNDNDGETLEAFLITPPRNGSVVLDDDGSFVYTPRANWFGTDFFKYRAVDPIGASGVGMAIINIVSGGNDDAPHLQKIGRKTVNELALLTFTASAYDPDGDPLAFSLGGTVPSGANITTDGVFAWTPTAEQGSGTYVFDVRVGDGEHVTSETITVTVAGAGEANTPPVLAPIGNKNVEELSLLTFTATATDSQTASNALLYSLGGAVPAGASITPAGVFSWTPTAAQGPGIYTFQVLVSDGILIAGETISVTVSSIPPLFFEFESPAFGHLTGRSSPDGLLATVNEHAAGYLAYGPYTTATPAGLNVATFEMMIDDVSANDAEIAVIDVFDFTALQTLATMTLHRRAFAAPMAIRSFSLWFEATAGHQLEFRTRWLGNSFLKLDRVVVTPSDGQLFQAETAATTHETGLVEPDGWSANPAQFNAGLLAIVPIGSPSSGTHTATYRLLVDNNTANSDAVAMIDVFDVTLGRVVAAKSIARDAFRSVFHYQDFELAFEAIVGHQYRLRTHWLDTAYIKQDYAFLR